MKKIIKNPLLIILLLIVLLIIILFVYNYFVNTIRKNIYERFSTKTTTRTTVMAGSSAVACNDKLGKKMINSKCICTIKDTN